MLTLYTKSNCPWCIRVKDYVMNKLCSKSTNYLTIINLDNNLSQAQKLIELTHQKSIPVLMNDDGKFIIGFNKRGIDELIDEELQ